jgi:SAM-dependent methyltransferase
VTTCVTGVSELVLEVADLVAAERFYAGVLGLPVVERWPDREATWLMAGDRTRIGLWRPQVGTAGGRGGAHVHFALHVPEAAFDAAVERLREEGFEPEVTGRRSDRSVYVYDPDANCVELWTKDVSELRAGLGAVGLEAASIAHFDATARQYDRSYDERNLRAHRRHARLEAVLALLGGEGGELLEVGTGTGRLLEALHQRGWSVTAIDAAAGMVDLARARVPAVADRIVVARAEELPFPSAAFDAVVAIGVLEYTRMDVALRELVRVLRSGGRAVLGFRADTPTAVWQRSVVLPPARRLKSAIPMGRPLPPPRQRPIALRDLREILDSAGLVVESAESVGATVVPDPLDRLMPRLAYRAARLAERSPRLRVIFGMQRVILATKP